MGDHKDSFFRNILLKNIESNIPLLVDVLTPYKKIPVPNKKIDSSSTSEMKSYIGNKYNQISINRLKQDLPDEIKRYISSLEKSYNKSYIEEYIIILKDQISRLRSEVIFLRKELNNKNELVTLLTAAKSRSMLTV